jgi:Ras-related protein Rab-7A
VQDTAGQERFSTLSSAFFRGADAALLIFDVTSPESMHALKKWWNDFREKAPVEDDDVQEYCCVVVGNKTDKGNNKLVGESEALEFIDELVPPLSTSSPSSPQQHVIIPQISFPHPETEASHTSLHRTDSISIASQKHRQGTPPPSKSRSSASSRFYSNDTTKTTLTLYHTPSSSIYESARSSPEPHPPIATSPRQRRLMGLSSSSSGSASTSSVATMTPSLFAREHASQTEAAVLSTSDGSSVLPPERGPKLFFTSAKTGEGVEDVFGYVVKRVVGRWEHEEAMVAFRDAEGEHEAIRLDAGGGEDGDRRGWSACCA